MGTHFSASSTIPHWFYTLSLYAKNSQHPALTSSVVSKLRPHMKCAIEQKRWKLDGARSQLYAAKVRWHPVVGSFPVSVCLVCAEAFSCHSSTRFLLTNVGYFHLNSTNIQLSWAAQSSVLMARLLWMNSKWITFSKIPPNTNIAFSAQVPPLVHSLTTDYVSPG